MPSARGFGRPGSCRSPGGYLGSKLKWRAPPEYSEASSTTIRRLPPVFKGLIVISTQASIPTAPPGPKRADARRNHERILTAARSAFADGGQSTSLEEIARQAGVGIGTLYRHFPTRQALLETLYVKEVE